MKQLTNGQNIEIENTRPRLKDLGINHKCYVFVSGDDKNSVQRKEITAYGLQKATIITKEYGEPEPKGLLLENGEHVLIEGIEFKTILMGDYSDCIHFEEIGYDGQSKLKGEY